MKQSLVSNVSNLQMFFPESIYLYVQMYKFIMCNNKINILKFHFVFFAKMAVKAKHHSLALKGKKPL
jgi:hypothetical protein